MGRGGTGASPECGGQARHGQHTRAQPGGVWGRSRGAGQQHRAFPPCHMGRRQRVPGRGLDPAWAERSPCGRCLEPDVSLRADSCWDEADGGTWVRTAGGTVPSAVLGPNGPRCRAVARGRNESGVAPAAPAGVALSADGRVPTTCRCFSATRVSSRELRAQTPFVLLWD